MNGVLRGIKVIDCSSVLAGPLAGSFLAESGAQVIKVEAPGGDVTRTWLARGEQRDSTSAYYEAANEGKNVHRVNLKSSEGRSWLAHELEDADVLLQNFKWNDLESMGLMPDVLAKRFPRLVHVRLVGFEHDAERLAYDVVIQAETGFMSMNGDPASPPSRLPVALMDVLASHQIRSAVLGGLLERNQIGTAPYAEVSLLGSGLTALANQGTAALMNGTTPQRQGSIHPTIAPYGDILVTSNGPIVLAVGSDAQFEHLCEVLGVPHLSQRQEFATNPRRVDNREPLMTLLNQAAADRDRDGLLKEFRQSNVPAGAIKTVNEALADPQVRRDYVVGEGDNLKLRTSAIRMTRFH